MGTPVFLRHNRAVGYDRNDPGVKILVTGAAGLLGGEICARLVAGGHEVHALVRKTPDVRANDGQPVAVASVLTGDVTQPMLGLAADPPQCDLVIHCAATTRFDLAEEDYLATNVGGVHNAIAFAEARGAALLHVSTAYVCGRRDGTIGEGDPLPETGFANGYEASKAAGEKLVRGSALDWAIARPSVVLGEHESGAIRQFDTTYAAFKLIAEGRVKHMEARPQATLDFVPIDHVAKGIVALAQRMNSAAGGTFHLVSGQPLPVEDFAAAIGAVPHFHRPELVAPEDFDPAALPPLERRLYRRVAGLYAAYFQRNPQFDASRFETLTGLACPPTGSAYIARLIGYCMEAGFLPRA